MSGKKTIEKIKTVVLCWTPTNYGKWQFSTEPLEQMLNNGYEVVRTDAVPGTVDRQSNMIFPPSTVYILRKNIRRLE